MIEWNKSFKVSKVWKLEQNLNSSTTHNERVDLCLLKTVYQILKSESIVKGDISYSEKWKSPINDKPLIPIFGVKTNKFEFHEFFSQK